MKRNLEVRLITVVVLLGPGTRKSEYLRGMSAVARRG